MHIPKGRYQHIEPYSVSSQKWLVTRGDRCADQLNDMLLPVPQNLRPPLSSCAMSPKIVLTG